MRVRRVAIKRDSRCRNGRHAALSVASGFPIVTNVEPLQQGNPRLESGQTDQAGTTRVTTVGASPIVEKARNDRGGERAHAQPQPGQSSTMSYFAVMALSLICGALGALGYSHFFGPKSGEPTSQSSAEQGPSKESTLTSKSSGGSSSNSAKDSGPGASTEQAGNLKQQIMSLNKRIDRLGERVDRLQELLSLAVPLLQRMAPKQ
jgi:hypothetical protein